MRDRSSSQVVEGRACHHASLQDLLGGFAVLDLSGFDEALRLCQDYAQILGGTLEIDVRLLEDGEPPATAQP